MTAGQNDGLAPYEAFTVVAALPKGAVSATGPILEERWTVGRSLTPTPLTGALAAAILVPGLARVFWLVGTRGRDRRYAGMTPGPMMVPGHENVLRLFKVQPVHQHGPGSRSLDEVEEKQPYVDHPSVKIAHADRRKSGCPARAAVPSSAQLQLRVSGDDADPIARRRTAPESHPVKRSIVPLRRRDPARPGPGPPPPPRRSSSSTATGSS